MEVPIYRPPAAEAGRKRPRAGAGQDEPTIPEGGLGIRKGHMDRPSLKMHPILIGFGVFGGRQEKNVYFCRLR